MKLWIKLQHWFYRMLIDYRTKQFIEFNKEREKYMQAFVGKTLIIVPETYENGYTAGYSENYIRVYVAGEMEKRPTQVCVERLFKDGVLAKSIEEKGEN